MGTIVSHYQKHCLVRIVDPRFYHPLKTKSTSTTEQPFMESIMAEEVDDEDFLIEAALWTLEQKARWNTLAPVSHLPQEILLKIFSYHCDGEPSPTHLPTWLSITHMCQLFWSISLNCLSLWNKSVLSSSEWTQVTLSRAGMVPLEIDAYFLTPHERIKRQNLCIVLSHLSRIQSLSITGLTIVLPRH